MGLFNKVLGAFVEIEEKKATPKQEVPSNNGMQQMTQNVSYTPNGLQPVDTSKFANHFDEVFKKANLPHPDYYEWQEALKTLLTSLPEPTAYDTAYNVLNKMGLNKETLVSSASHYVNIIDKDAAEFQKTIDTEINLKVEARKREIADITKANEERVQQITKLNQEIAEGNLKMQQLNQEIFESENKIKSAQAAYTIVATERKNTIETHMQKFNTYYINK